MSGFEEDGNVTLQKYFINTLYWIVSADPECNDPQNNIFKIYLKVSIFFKKRTSTTSLTEILMYINIK